ncbi:SMa0974 family conjugal transfer regulator [Shinella sp.]|uniref:SMa0974 family conjugal transfer regulator n=1 Tax=Shinella sp. TaxID=1870904 RepID=UPI003D28AB99
MRKDDTHVRALHVAEALIQTKPAERIATVIRVAARDYCSSMTVIGLETRLTFEDAMTIITSAADQLRIRVEARDLVMFYGIRILLQTAVSEVLSPSQAMVEWRTPSSYELERSLMQKSKVEPANATTRAQR